MKAYCVVLLLLISITQADEVYANDTNGYVNQTAWQETVLPNQYVNDGEVINKEAKILEERITAPPKVLTERITAEPRIIEESLELPIRQKLIQQDTVLNKNIRARPLFLQEPNTYVER